MAATPAQIEANRRNAARSTGPKTEEGKSRSRANSLKRGMTGAGIVLPKRDAAEVERLTEAFRAEMKPEGAVGEVLIRRMAVHAVRMDRAVVQESAALSAHVRDAAREFRRTGNIGADNARTLQIEACNKALFDASPEATLARRYEAASQRGFLTAYQELRRMRAESLRAADASAKALAKAQKPAEAPAPTPAETPAPKAESGSFFPSPPAVAASPAKPQPAPARPRPMSPKPAPSPLVAHCDIPLTIGRAR